MKYLDRGVLKIFLCMFIVYILVTGVECRGGRGGGGRGGGRSGYRGGSRGGSGRMSRGSSSYTRSTWKAAFIGGAVLGSSYYMRSSRYYSNPSHMPTICTNLYDMRNSSGHQFSYFVCPREGEADNHDYCCGPANREHCCPFTESTGFIIGIVIGCAVGASLIFIIIYCICKRTRSPGKISSKKTTTVTEPDQGVVYTTPPSAAGPPPPYDNKTYYSGQPLPYEPFKTGSQDPPQAYGAYPADVDTQPYPADVNTQPYPQPNTSHLAQPYPAQPLRLDSSESNPVQPYPNQPNAPDQPYPAQPYAIPPYPAPPYPGEPYPTKT